MFILRKSEQCHFPSILVDDKDPRTGQEVLTWKVTTSLNHSRGLVLRHLKVQLVTLRGKDTPLRQSGEGVLGEHRWCCGLKDLKMQRGTVKVFLETEMVVGWGRGGALGLHLKVETLKHPHLFPEPLDQLPGL